MGQDTSAPEPKESRHNRADEVHDRATALRDDLVDEDTPDRAEDREPSKPEPEEPDEPDEPPGPMPPGPPDPIEPDEPTEPRPAQPVRPIEPIEPVEPNDPNSPDNPSPLPGPATPPQRPGYPDPRGPGMAPQPVPDSVDQVRIAGSTSPIGSRSTARATGS